jgi:hypothetical protein
MTEAEEVQIQSVLVTKDSCRFAKRAWACVTNTRRVGHVRHTSQEGEWHSFSVDILERQGIGRDDMVTAWKTVLTCLKHGSRGQTRAQKGEVDFVVLEAGGVMRQILTREGKCMLTVRRCMSH